jgi:hypothetical protein
MKKIIQAEEVAMLGITIYTLYLLKADWWIYLLLFCGPDISMLGYAAGNKAGAISYNLFHHKAIAVAIFLIGLILQNHWLELTGLILFGHSCMDRMLGYGLKHFTGFQFTHLGQIGRVKSNSTLNKTSTTIK